jgi:hypothetical protein
MEPRRLGQAQLDDLVALPVDRLLRARQTRVVRERQD